MELSFGEEYEQFRQVLRTFIQTNKDTAPQGLRSTKAAQDWQKLLIKNGYTARTIPEAYGGFGAKADIIKSRIIAEEFASAGIPGGMGNQGISMLVPTLLEVGSESQRLEFIKPTITGDIIWCQGYSEPGAGSDLASLRTKASLEGDEWVVNGQKIWTSSAHVADWIFCLVRTEPEAKKHHGISFLLFRMDTPGIEIRPLVDMTGAANFNEVFFTDVRVPKDQIVGTRGQGWMVANAILGHERDMLGDPNGALSRLNALISLAKSETINGEKLIEHPVFRDRLMRLQGRVMAMQFNDMRILSSRLNPDQDAKIARMIVKLQGTELRHDIEGLGIDMMGEIGLCYGDNPDIRDNGSWQGQYMFQLGLIIGGGTSQIQKNIISERGLDMPREPRPQQAI
ncbi:MAG: alkylation response protein AidB-like acyl-CoA dehydrogenase [Flavobacterium sp.]|jgi:alkylation response protein AidB-like acyl-CoA dehydrogenase